MVENTKPKKLIYSWEQLNKDCEILAKSIKEHFKGRGSVRKILYVPRGGAVPATKLSHLLGCEFVFPANPTNIRSLEFGENVILVDDICDTGNKLLQQIKEGYSYTNPCHIMVTLFKNKNSRFSPDYFIRSSDSDTWIEFPWEGELPNDETTNH